LVSFFFFDYGWYKARWRNGPNPLSVKIEILCQILTILCS
jgi:hypothetical protein